MKQKPAATPSFTTIAQLTDVSLQGMPSPAMLHVVVDLACSWERARLEQAIRRTVASFPVLGCRYRQGLFRDRWVADPSVGMSEVLELRDVPAGPEEATRELTARELDSCHGWPWRVAQLRGARETRLVISLNHAVGDGAAAMTVAGELAYWLVHPDDGPRTASACKERGTSLLLRALRLRHAWPLLLGLLREACRPWHFPFLARIAEHPSRAQGAACARAVVFQIGPDSHLGRLCRRAGCTVNDLLLAGLAVLIHARTARGRLGCFYTVNLRRLLPPGGRWVANLSAVDGVFLPRTAGATLEQAATEVARRTTRAKARLPGLPSLLANLGWGWLMPHAVLRRWVRTLMWRWIEMIFERGLSYLCSGPREAMNATCSGARLAGCSATRRGLVDGYG